jgi:hypothetical protein
MTVTATLNDPSLAVDDADRVLLACPVDPGEHVNTSCARTSPIAGGEVPWWSLTDGAPAARLHVATQGTSTERREALVSCWPSARASRVGAFPAPAGTKEDEQ